MPIATSTALLIGGLASAGTGIYGANRQGRAAQQAARVSQQGNDAQLAYLRQQAEEDRRRYDQQVAQERAQWDAHQARRAPYRAAADAVLARVTGQPVNRQQDVFVPSTPPPGTTGQAPPMPQPQGQQARPLTLGTMSANRPPAPPAPLFDTNVPQMTLSDALRRRN